jgi:hypothetical protein
MRNISPGKFFGFLKMREKSAPDKEGERNERKDDARAESRFFRIWNGVLPLLLGLVFGWLCMVLVEVRLDVFSRRENPAAAVPVLSDEASTLETMNIASFLAANPFKISPMPVPDVVSEDEGAEAPVQIVGSLATAVLKGTSPGFVAWMEDHGQLRLVLVGDRFDVYTLKEVSYTKAVFVKDDERVVKELLYSKQAPAPRAAAQPARSGQGAAAPADIGQNVVAADPVKGEEGVIAQTLISSLMENPFDELKKVRLRPASEERGLQIQWINRDSILSQLGIQKNDVIRSINGIPLQNMMDITNSMSSLMNSERFDVEVTRDGASTSLRYVVR